MHDIAENGFTKENSLNYCLAITVVDVVER